MKVYKIVLTGGPCAGKTKILEFLMQELKNTGYYVIVVPETASECIRNNIVPNDERQHTLMFQDIMLCNQYVKENSAEKYAEFIKNKTDVIILYDRAVMDNRAYLSQEDYDNLLKKYNINELELINKYDLVIDLISTATLKQDSYELNDTRSEDIDKASARDKLTSLAWLLHRNLKVIKPTDEIEEKENIVLEYIYDLLNNNQKNDFATIEIDQESSNFLTYDKNNSKTINIKKIWLNNPNDNQSNYILSKRQYNGFNFYELDKVNNEILEESIRITKEEYLEMIGLYGVSKIENINELLFVDNGNYFCIINDGSKLYLQTQRQNIPFIPDNIVLKDNKAKTLIKK